MKVIFTFLLALFICGCGEKEEIISQTQKTFKDIDVITGLEFYDFNGASLGIWAKPNSRPGNILCFPIPANDVISISSTDIIEHIYLIPTSCIKDSTMIDLAGQLANLEYQLEDIEDIKIFDAANSSMSQQLNLNLSSVDSGIYRLFFLMEDQGLLWQNIYVDSDMTSFPDLNFLEDLCE